MIALRLVVLFAAGCGFVPCGERELGPGTAAVVSPDGSRIAFQRDRGGHLAVGVCGRSGGAVEWIKDGPGNAAYPAWTPDGRLVFTYGHDTNTAFAAAHRSATDGGYNLYLWNGASVRQLTDGRKRDFGASVAADGTVCFVTSRGEDENGSAFAGMCKTRIVKARLSDLERESGTPHLTPVRTFAAKSNAGAMHPTVSPDGRSLLRCEMKGDGLRAPWRIVVSPVDRTDDIRYLTPSNAVSYAPRWSPDGRHICYTSCKFGDPGWCVYVQDLTTNAEKRLCEGRNPCFSPDGRSILYDRGGIIYERPYDVGGEP